MLRAIQKALPFIIFVPNEKGEKMLREKTSHPRDADENRISGNNEKTSLLSPVHVAGEALSLWNKPGSLYCFTELSKSMVCCGRVESWEFAATVITTGNYL